MEKQLTGYPSVDKPWLKYYEEAAFTEEFPECSVYESVKWNNNDHQEDIAIDFCGHEITYGQLFDKIESLAGKLLEYGVKEQEIVSICLPNIPEAIYLFYALNVIGAVCNLVDPRANENVMAEHIRMTECRFLFTVTECYDLFRSIRKKAGLERIIVLNVTESLLPFEGFQDFDLFDVTWKDFIEGGKRIYCYKKEKRNISLPICILHTGGTTGVPKGAVLSDRNLHSVAISWKYLKLAFERGNTILGLMPPVASYGLICNIHIPLYYGMKIYLIPEYDPERITDQIQKYKPNCIAAALAHWEMIFISNEMKELNWGFLKCAFNAGDTLKPQIEEGLNEMFERTNPGLKIIKGYGMTESSTGVSTSCFNEINMPGSVGIPLPLTTIGVFDDKGEELTYEESGEICVRSDGVMLGYYKNDETEKVLKKHKDGQLWLHTGDIGSITREGILYIRGRIKRIIIRFDGLKIYPFDIENKLNLHSCVKKCAVVGAKDPSHIQGRVPVAFVVSAENANVDEMEMELRSYSENNIIDYMVPYAYYFVEDIPYTANGKIDFNLLESIAGKLTEMLKNK